MDICPKSRGRYFSKCSHVLKFWRFRLICCLKLSKITYVCDDKVVKTVFRGLSRLLSIWEYADLGQAGQDNTELHDSKLGVVLNEDTPPT